MFFTKAKIPRKLRSLAADIIGVILNDGLIQGQVQETSKRKWCATYPTKKTATNSCYAVCNILICLDCAFKIYPNSK